MEMSKFEQLLKQRLLREARNYYPDKFNNLYEGQKRPFKKKAIGLAKRVLFRPTLLHVAFLSPWFFRSVFLKVNGNIQPYFERLDKFHDLLATDQSKDLFLQLLAYRILGAVKVRLPLDTPDYWSTRKAVDDAGDKERALKVPYKPWVLPLHDLSDYGYPIKLYLYARAVHTVFCLPHYCHKEAHAAIRIGPEVGDTVLDLGGCYGDTALYFANEVGAGGKVFVFEFIPGNLEILRKNLDLNPELSQRIEVVEKPLWDTSDLDVYYTDKGASSTVNFSNFPGSDGQSLTTTIDDFVESEKLDRVDLVKTDIEGAEPFAIAGAVKTLRRFKPKLAISIYHGMSDFSGIIHQINELDLGYEFYFRHATTHTSETILFCKVP